MFLKRKDCVVTDYASLRDQEFKNKDMLDLMQLGKQVIELKFKGMDNSILVPLRTSSRYAPHLIGNRPDLFRKGKSKIEWRKRYTFVKSLTLEAMSTYQAEDGSSFNIWGGFQLRTELKYGFTSIVRGEVAPMFKKPKLLKAIKENEWIFAKTMPENPHFYALRKEWDDNTIAFDDFVLTIRGYGYTEIYMGAAYRCYGIGKYFYWSMGAPVSITILINRKLIKK